ncbi:MAG: response regulator transcription factor [Candidatus Omnitrophica bacterium]|nr:response regulator transcription factor [Candidatus Omnitrophota bacterium]
MEKEKILIVEDDKDIAKLLEYNLDKSGFRCKVCSDGFSARDIIDNSKKYDLFILDIMVPGMDGLELCKLIRKNHVYDKTPILFLTAKGEETDRIVGFEIGADDYVVKPFSMRELMLRIKAMLKRHSLKEYEEEAEKLIFKDMIIDITEHKVAINKKEIALTLMEFNLLYTLVKRKGRVQTRDVLLDDVWGMDTVFNTRTIDTHIKQLRQKIGKYGSNIETVRGLGYRYNE